MWECIATSTPVFSILHSHSNFLIFRGLPSVPPHAPQPAAAGGSPPFPKTPRRNSISVSVGGGAILTQNSTARPLKKVVVQSECMVRRLPTENRSEERR